MSLSSRAALSDAVDASLDSLPLTAIFAHTPFLFSNNNGRVDRLIRGTGSKKHREWADDAEANTDTDCSETSITSAWRNSLWHITFANMWNFNTSRQDVTNTYKSLIEAIEPIRQMTPPGAYQVRSSDITS
jgi:hypothetical protein